MSKTALKRIRKGTIHYGESFGYGWDLGFIFSDEMPRSKSAKNRDECRERARAKKRVKYENGE